jgi:hypothetical protein
LYYYGITEEEEKKCTITYYVSHVTSFSERGQALSWNSNSDFLAARSGAELSDKIVEVIKKEHSFPIRA